MATGNVIKYEVGEATTNKDSILIPASCRIFKDLSDVYINPLESISMGTESPRLQKDSVNETPNKYPNAPQSSPIDAQHDPDISVFNAELIKCLSSLPVKLVSSEESTENGSPEISVFLTEDHARTYSEAAVYTESKVTADNYEEFQYRYENGTSSMMTSYGTKNISDPFARDGTNELTEPFPMNGDKQIINRKYLTVDYVRDLNTSLHRRSTLSDNESTVANCCSDASDVEDVEHVPSDGDSCCASRNRIELEALALDSSIRPSIFQRIQHWKTLSRNKRAYSLDEMNPLNELCSHNFSTTEFELTV